MKQIFSHSAASVLNSEEITIVFCLHLQQHRYRSHFASKVLYLCLPSLSEGVEYQCRRSERGMSKQEIQKPDRQWEISLMVLLFCNFTESPWVLMVWYMFIFWVLRDNIVNFLMLGFCSPDKERLQITSGIGSHFPRSKCNHRVNERERERAVEQERGVRRGWLNLLRIGSEERFDQFKNDTIFLHSISRYVSGSTRVAVVTDKCYCNTLPLHPYNEQYNDFKSCILHDSIIASIHFISCDHNPEQRRGFPSLSTSN